MKVRTIKEHVVEGDYFSKNMRVEVFGEVGVEGMHSNYTIRAGSADGAITVLKFQQGDPKDHINGISNEALLAVVLDRLKGSHAGEFSSQEKRSALTHVSAALGVLGMETEDCIGRGITWDLGLSHDA